MAHVSTSLNFRRSTEQAFEFYRGVFGTEYTVPLQRFSSVPAAPGQPPMAEADRRLIMHVELPILGGHVLRGTDAPELMGLPFVVGTNVHLTLEPDSRVEARRLFDALSVGGKVEQPLQEVFWGAYFGSLTDQFGVRWMVNCASKV